MQLNDKRERMAWVSEQERKQYYKKTMKYRFYCEWGGSKHLGRFSFIIAYDKFPKIELTLFGFAIGYGLRLREI